jgi:superoxide oxidase
MNNTHQRYSTLVISLHWFIFLLMIAIYATMEFRGIFPKGSDPRELMKSIHFMLGASLLFLVMIRIAARIFSVTPDIVPPLKPQLKILSKLMHLALYTLMIAMPISGWIMLNANGKPVPFFGLELPVLIAPDKALAERLHDLHEIGATLGYVLIGLHTAAAFFHHYVMKNNVLLRMSFLKK